MSDYLDLLLDGITGQAPLAEPRIDAAVISSGMEPALEEVQGEALATPVRRSVSMPEPQRVRFETEAPEDVPEVPSGRPVEHLQETRVEVHHTSKQEGESIRQSVFETREIHHTHEARLGATPQTKEPAPAVAREFPGPQFQTMERLQPAPAVPEHGLRRDVPRATALPLPAATAPPQPVSIRIERIEVRAASSVPAPSPMRPGGPPRLSLDDYLRRRSGGKR